MCTPPCTFTEVPLEQIDVRWDGPAVGRKALAYPKRKTIYLDSAFWLSVPSVVGRAGLLAHERGHIEGARCEPCADRRGGEILKREGWPTARDAQVVAIGRLENRDGQAAADELGQGFGADGFLEHRERAAGVVNELQQLVDVVANRGVQFEGRTWSVMVGLDGGVRSDARQFELFKRGRTLVAGKDPSLPSSWSITGEVVTYASSAKNGKHGRAQALDLWIVGVDGQPLLYPRYWKAAGLSSMAGFEGVYLALGVLGESLGLVWGGRWVKLKDRPHFETRDSSAAPLVSALTGSPNISGAEAAGEPDVEFSVGAADDGGFPFAAIGAGLAVLAVFVCLSL